MKTLRSRGHSAWVVALVAASPLLQGADGGCVAGGKIVVGSGNADNDAGADMDAGEAELDSAAPPVVDAAGGQDVTQDVTVVAADGGVGNAEAGQGGGTCQYPPNVQVESDGLGVGGCFAEPPVKLCQAGGCSSMCSGSQYEMVCRGLGAPGSSIPQPDSTLGCQIIVMPTPSNELFYCCPCEANDDAGVVDSGVSAIPSGMLLALLPGPDEVGQWVQSGTVNIIADQTGLFGYIDGAAPKYINYGWLESVYASYQQGSEMIQLAIHDMGTAANALGLYTYELPPDNQPTSAGLTNSVIDLSGTTAYASYSWSGRILIEMSIADKTVASEASITAFTLDVLNRVGAAGYR